MQCNCCKKETSNAPEPCIRMTKNIVGEKHTMHYSVSTTAYRIDPVKTYEFVYTCDECFLRDAKKIIEEKSNIGCVMMIIGVISLIFGPLLLWLAEETVLKVIGGFCLLSFIALLIMYFVIKKSVKPLEKLSDEEKIEWCKKKYSVILSIGTTDVYIPVKMAKDLTPERIQNEYRIPFDLAQKLPEIARRYV